MSIRRDGLDSLFSQWVRTRDGWQCRCCGKADGQIDCAHIVGRRNRQTRWDDANAVALCRGCHMFFTDNPLDWNDWVLTNLGSDHIEAVRERARSTEKVTQSDKEAITQDLIAKLEDMGEVPVWKGGKRKSKKRKAKHKRTLPTKEHPWVQTVKVEE